MINDQLITWVATCLRDAGTGVNAQLAGVPRAPGEPAPPAVTVLDCYTDEDVANGVLPDARRDQGPFLIVGPANTSSFAGVLFDGATDASEVAVMYADGRSDGAAALRAAHRTLRAVRRVLALRFAGLGNAALDLGGCTIDPPERIRVVTTDGDLGEAQVTAVAFLPFPALDRWALGAPA